MTSETARRAHYSSDYASDVPKIGGPPVSKTPCGVPAQSAELAGELSPARR